MTRTAIAGGAIVAALVLLFAVVMRGPTPEQHVDRSSPTAAAENQPGFLYGRIAVEGNTYEGRLRWGRVEEAFWSDYFDGRKRENPWAAYAPDEQHSPFEIFGFKIGGRAGARDLARPFMTRFGDIARVEAHFRDVRVTLKSGTVFVLDRFEAGDIDDGVRVWDSRHGIVDLDAQDIRTIEFLPTPPLVAAAGRLHGTMRTRHGDFTGFIQWDLQDSVGDDELEGRTADGDRRLRYDAIRSIARRSRDSALVTLTDGREIVLSESRDVSQQNRGIYIDDARYGRVLIGWGVFERVEFSTRGSGPAYGDFMPGRPLRGSVTTRDGRRLAGRLVYDFDESETTETFDVTYDGMDYQIPFGRIASIVPRSRDGKNAQPASVTLHDGEVLHFEHNGDLWERNVGMLIFVDGRERPEYVPWADVDQIDFDRTPTQQANSPN